MAGGNRPCSTTPGIAASRCASSPGSPIGPKWPEVAREHPVVGARRLVGHAGATEGSKRGV